jgi:hypothetical protein
MAKMYKIQERNSLEFGNQINACNGLLYSESLMGTREMGDTGNVRTMNANLDKICLSNSDKRDSVPLVSTNLSYTENIASGEKAVLNIITKFLESMSTHGVALEATDLGVLMGFNWDGEAVRGDKIKYEGAKGIYDNTGTRLSSTAGGGGRNRTMELILLVSDKAGGTSVNVQECMDDGCAVLWERGINASHKFSRKSIIGGKVKERRSDSTDDGFMLGFEDVHQPGRTKCFKGIIVHSVDSILSCILDWFVEIHGSTDGSASWVKSSNIAIVGEPGTFFCLG